MAQRASVSTENGTGGGVFSFGFRVFCERGGVCANAGIVMLMICKKSCVEFFRHAFECVTSKLRELEVLEMMDWQAEAGEEFEGILERAVQEGAEGEESEALLPFHRERRISLGC